MTGIADHRLMAWAGGSAGMWSRSFRSAPQTAKVLEPDCPAYPSASAHGDLQDECPQPNRGACRSGIGADVRIWQSVARRPRWWRGWQLRAHWSQMPCPRAWQRLEIDRVWKVLHAHIYPTCGMSCAGERSNEGSLLQRHFMRCLACHELSL